MAELSSFVQHGWQNIWKQKTIWLFGALPFFIQLILPAYNNSEKNLGLALLYILGSFITIILGLISSIGIPYLAYSFSNGESATIPETLDAVNRFLWRVIGCSCIAFLFIMPCFILVLGIALQKMPRADALSTAVLALMPLSIFACLGNFTMFGFFENDWGVRKSIKNAWDLFTSHFGVLATLGVSFIALSRLSSAVIGAVTVLVQSGFDVASLSSLNFVSPSMTLGKNVLFMIVNGITQTVYGTFATSVFVVAYLKYSGGKNRLSTK